MRGVTLILLGILAAGFICELARAQGGPPLNRRLENFAIVPNSTGGWDVRAVWTVEASGSSAGLNYSTTVAVFVGDNAEVPSATKSVEILFDSTTGICGVPNCAGGCGSGFIDGVLNTMLCLPDLPCPAGNCDCGCRFPSITTPLPGIDMQPGDEITVILYPSPGAIPDADTSDDSLSRTFKGNPSYWNRRLTAAELEPAGPGLFDLHIKWDFAVSDMDIPVPIGGEFLVLVNGQSAGTFSDCDWIAAPPPTGCERCSGLCSQADSNCGGVDMTCQIGDYVPACACRSSELASEIPQLPLTPGDAVIVILLPAPGGLPELPGLDDDEREVPPSFCFGDVDGDAIVGPGDLAVLLGNWLGEGAGDLNLDGVVNAADLALLLGAWGPCFPV